MKKTIARNEKKLKTDQRPQKKSLIGYLLSYIMEFNAERIENDKKRLPSFLKLFSTFNIKYWYSPGEAGIKNMENK